MLSHIYFPLFKGFFWFVFPRLPVFVNLVTLLLHAGQPVVASAGSPEVNAANETRFM